MFTGHELTSNITYCRRARVCRESHGRHMTRLRQVLRGELE